MRILSQAKQMVQWNVKTYFLEKKINKKNRRMSSATNFAWHFKG